MVGISQKQVTQFSTQNSLSREHSFSIPPEGYVMMADVHPIRWKSILGKKKNNTINTCHFHQAHPCQEMVAKCYGVPGPRRPNHGLPGHLRGLVVLG